MQRFLDVGTTDMASATASKPAFVPDDFRVPVELAVLDQFHLKQITHLWNDVDYAAWKSSMSHIRETPGFETYPWPFDMTLEQNEQDLRKHEKDFANREGFTYSVFVGSELAGCVYIYPSRTPGVADVRSWVSAGHAALDQPLYRAVSQWLAEVWPFDGVNYSKRG
ncbi:N-acetyltransferase [Paractinoplanes ovalisporus]|uniref:N-acetyltransferase n=1 Tax=Paractinoplanes ovalisporus TaxID=2810368 RepID=UPI001F391766|nr:N-acetyltransferase [Actinoplanes ovalisporus]